MESLHRVGRRQARSAIDVLARAFFHDEILRYYFPDDEMTLRIARRYMAFAVYASIRCGEVYATSGSFEGIATWFAPGTYPIPHVRFALSTPIADVIAFCAAGGLKMKAAGDHFESLHAKLVPNKHWYLQVLGVDPDHRGRGHSSSLLRPMLARFDRESLPCYLETTSERNVAIYEHFGFESIHKGTIPTTTVPYWCMMRGAETLR